ncbi:MAG: hypothetical protein K8R25_10315 [Methanosarcinales archaeon]|nr:hypothetical protein [Methanosarcinales archaeon]
MKCYYLENTCDCPYPDELEPKCNFNFLPKNIKSFRKWLIVIFLRDAPFTEKNLSGTIIDPAFIDPVVPLILTVFALTIVMQDVSIRVAVRRHANLFILCFVM